MDLAKWGVAGVCGSYPGPSWLSFQVALSHHTPHLRDPGWGVCFLEGRPPGTGLAGTISAAMLTALIHSLISFTKSLWFWSRLLGVHSESLLPGGGTRHFPSLSFSSLVR